MRKVDVYVKIVPAVIIILLVAAVVFEPILSASVEVGRTGPFGFEAEMSLEEVKRMVGEENVERVEKDNFRVKVIPRPHPLFKSYTLTVCLKRGIVGLEAISKPIHTSIYGIELKREFERIKKAVSGIYGEYDELDFLMSGSIWNEPQDYMMGLLRRERVLIATWPKDVDQKLIEKDIAPLKDNILSIMLAAIATDISKGGLGLSYKFEGWCGYVNERKKREREAF